MKKTRVGIIGSGNIAIYWAHVPSYKTVEECEITAICDIDEAKLKKVGDELGIPENRRFTDYHDLIACEDVDVVDISTWNSNHCEIAQAAALAGKSFSIEKPVGMNYTEAYDLVKTVEMLKWGYGCEDIDVFTYGSYSILGEIAQILLGINYTAISPMKLSDIITNKYYIYYNLAHLIMPEAGLYLE